MVYAEDNQGDVLLLEQAFSEKSYAVEIQVLPDWDQALRYLKVKETARDAPPPDLLLLDQRLPRGDGKTLMDFIATSDYLKRIPAYLISSPPFSEVLRGQFQRDRIIEKPALWDGYLVLCDQFMEAMWGFRASTRMVCRRLADQE